MLNKANKREKLMKNLSISIIFLFLFVSNAYAERGRTASSYGIGNESCGSFLMALSKSQIDEGLDYNGISYVADSRLYSEWMISFISAFNKFNDQQKNIGNADRDGTILWVKKWCETYPMKPFSSAVWDLVIEQSGFNTKLYK